MDSKASIYREAKKVIRRLDQLRLSLELFRVESGKSQFAGSPRAIHELRTEVFIACKGDNDTNSDWTVMAFNQPTYSTWAIFPDLSQMGAITRIYPNGESVFDHAFRWDRTATGYIIAIYRRLYREQASEDQIFLLVGPGLVEWSTMTKSLRRIVRPPCFYPYLFGGRIHLSEQEELLSTISRLFPHYRHFSIDLR